MKRHQLLQLQQEIEVLAAQPVDGVEIKVSAAEEQKLNLLLYVVYSKSNPTAFVTVPII